MVISIAYLGPTGTNSETAALAYVDWLAKERGQQSVLYPYPSIAQSLNAVAQQEMKLAIAPVENSIGGSVAITLDSLWQLDRLQIQQGLVLPIFHSLLSCSSCLDTIKTVYSHPQALAQCEKWLTKALPLVKQIPTNSTTEALQHLSSDPNAAAIASPRASSLYNIPILIDHLNDYPDNSTRFWVLGLNSESEKIKDYVSLAFSVPDRPGALVTPLQIFARRKINLCKIESRPTKRSLGDYIFFIDLEVNGNQESIQTALTELSNCTEVLKIFGNYNIINIQQD